MPYPDTVLITVGSHSREMAWLVWHLHQVFRTGLKGRCIRRKRPARQQMREGRIRLDFGNPHRHLDLDFSFLGQWTFSPGKTVGDGWGHMMKKGRCGWLNSGDVRWMWYNQMEHARGCVRTRRCSTGQGGRQGFRGPRQRSPYGMVAPWWKFHYPVVPTLQKIKDNTNFLWSFTIVFM